MKASCKHCAAAKGMKSKAEDKKKSVVMAEKRATAAHKNKK